MVRCAIATLLVATLWGCGGPPGKRGEPGPSAGANGTSAHPPPARGHGASAHPPFAVGLLTVTLVDHSRLVRLPARAPKPRTLVTVIRYPAIGAPTRADLKGAQPARAAGPFPLVIFGHGFAVTPDLYGRLLHAWAQSGYVVAAPIFPLENARAQGGPNESDLVNQPDDMSFVISRLGVAGAAARGPLEHLISSGAVAVAGHSDGGETALAAAYDRPFLDRRIRATVLLSGARPPGAGGFRFPAASPPLLAVQGGADTINPARVTKSFFDIVPQPKFLLTMVGAGHLDPYTDQEPQLGIVEAVTVAFLDRYLKSDRTGSRRMTAAGDLPGVSELQAEP